MGSVLGRLRPPEQAIVPHVCLPYITKEGAGGPPQSGFFGGMLGRAYDPLFVLKDPNAADFAVPELTLPADVSLRRLDRPAQALFRYDRRAVRTRTGRGGLRRHGRLPPPGPGLAHLGANADRPCGSAMKRRTVRDDYGRNIYGQSVLLARRMIEAGTRMVTISWAPDANATWDTHG